MAYTRKMGTAQSVTCFHDRSYQQRLCSCIFLIRWRRYTWAWRKVTCRNATTFHLGSILQIGTALPRYRLMLLHIWFGARSASLQGEPSMKFPPSNSMEPPIWTTMVKLTMRLPPSSCMDPPMYYRSQGQLIMRLPPSLPGRYFTVSVMYGKC